ncbi:MAG: hypothetical protein RJA31_33 [Actinomycetota bacterium]
MSAVAQTVYGYPRPQATTRPGLRAVARPRARVNVTTVTMLVTALIAIVVVRMFIYVAVESSAYEIASLHKQNVGLSRDAQFLQEQLNVLDSPQNLAAMAAELGMVSNSSPTYIQLSDGQVWGSGKPAKATTTTIAPIANDLIGAYGETPSLEGVATQSVAAVATQSESASTTPSTGIPAPSTH